MPFVRVKITNPHNGRFNIYECLLDTGADRCMLPHAVTQQLMSVPCGPKTSSKGIAGMNIDAYPHYFILELFSQNLNSIIWSLKKYLGKQSAQSILTLC